MIHYTLQGPSYELEIHEDKIRLIKKPWLKIFSKVQETTSWEITDLSQFEITVPKFLMISGKLQWSTFKGETGTFRFTTNPLMVKKIEAYLQKRVIKNHHAANNVKKLPERKKRDRPLENAA